MRYCISQGLKWLIWLGGEEMKVENRRSVRQAIETLRHAINHPGQMKSVFCKWAGQVKRWCSSFCYGYVHTTTGSSEEAFDEIHSFLPGFVGFHKLTPPHSYTGLHRSICMHAGTEIRNIFCNLIAEKGSVKVFGDDKLAFKGQLVLFECQAAGWSPQPTLRWQVNDKKVSTFSSSLLSFH